MITARNYAAQAERALIEEPPYIHFEELSAFVACEVQSIKRRVHFAIPDGGSIFDDNYRALHNSEIHLPFPEITVEFWNSLENIKVLIFASERVELGCVFITAAAADGNQWGFCPYMITVSTKEHLSLDMAYCITELSREFCDSLQENIRDSAKAFIRSSLHSVLELLEALSCRNVNADTIQKESTKNQSRVANGKLPFYETKVLVVVPHKPSAVRSEAANSSARTSPRQHLRRGHPRFLASGEKIWIPECVVGDPSRGVISKSYRIGEARQ